MKIFSNAYKTVLKTIVYLITSSNFTVYCIMLCFSCTTFTKKDVVFKGPIFFLNTISNSAINNVYIPNDEFGNSNAGIIQTEGTNITLSLNIDTTLGTGGNKIYLAKASDDGNNFFWDLILSLGPNDDFLSERLLNKNGSLYFTGFTLNSKFGIYNVNGVIARVDLEGNLKAIKVCGVDDSQQVVSEDVDFFKNYIVTSITATDGINYNNLLGFFDKLNLDIIMAKEIIHEQNNSIIFIYHSMGSVNDNIVLGGSAIHGFNIPSIVFFDNLKTSSWGYLLNSSLAKFDWDINFVEFVGNGSKVIVVGMVKMGTINSKDFLGSWFALISSNGTLEASQFLNISSRIVSALELENGNIIISTNNFEKTTLSVFSPNGTQIGSGVVEIFINGTNSTVLALSKFDDKSFVMCGTAFNSNISLPFYTKLPKKITLFDESCVATFPLFWENFTIDLIPKDFELKDFTFNCTTPNVSIIRSAPDIDTVCFFQPKKAFDLGWIQIILAVAGGLCLCLIICRYICCCYSQLAKRDAEKNRIVRFQNFGDLDETTGEINDENTNY